jgi:Fe-S cluster biogenesis protein NfuA
MTPNPATMKFVANRMLLLEDDAVEFSSVQAAKGYSPIAEAMLAFPFVTSIFITANFVTVTKTDNVDWDFIVMELRDFVSEWLKAGKEVLIKMPEDVGTANDPDEIQRAPRPVFEATEYDKKIVALLNEYVRPAVENDGGAIDFVGFKEGVVTLEMRGSCSGCPSSTMTLKGGIEQLLKSNMPEVKEVVALSA